MAVALFALVIFGNPTTGVRWTGLVLLASAANYLALPSVVPKKSMAISDPITTAISTAALRIS